jgi:release factor glutamine methyltransferase
MKPNVFLRPALMTTKKIELQTWINQAIRSLEHSETPFLEVQVITAHILAQSREWVIAHPDFQLAPAQVDQLDSALNRLVNGEPLAYITGKRSFYGLDFIVSPAVLVPRPETELLVEEAIQWLEENPRRRSAVDIGTGSGIIALTLADTFIDLKMTGLDISEDALKIARENAAFNHLQDRINWQTNDLLTDFEGSFDLILANLPYIPTQVLNSLEVIKHEPRLALDGGMDGMQLIRRLIEQIPGHIRPGGAIFLEIESTIGAQVQKIAEEHFPQAKIELQIDYAKLPRLVRIET